MFLHGEKFWGVEAKREKLGRHLDKTARLVTVNSCPIAVVFRRSLDGNETAAVSHQHLKSVCSALPQQLGAVTANPSHLPPQC